MPLKAVFGLKVFITVRDVTLKFFVTHFLVLYEKLGNQVLNISNYVIKKELLRIFKIKKF